MMDNKNKLDELKASDVLNKRVLTYAKANIAKVSVIRNVKYFAPIGCVCFLLGVLTTQILSPYGNNPQYPKVSPIIHAPVLNFRGDNNQTVKSIDLRELSSNEIDVLIVELIANDDTRQANQVILWLEQQNQR